MKKIQTLILGLALALSFGVSAHTDEYLDTVSAPHGGQLRMAGGSHYELVVKPDAIQVFVTDHAGNATSVKGAKGTATVIAGLQKQNITLLPKDANLLEGVGKFDPTKPVKAIVNIQLSGQEPQQASFDIAKLKRGAESPNGDEHQGHKH